MSTEENTMLFGKFERVSKSLEDLEAGLSSLSTQLRNDESFRVDYLAVLPYRKSEEEDVPSIITPEPVPAEEAAPEYLASLLSAIRYRDDQHPKSTIRAPGLIGVSAETMEKIAEVNTLKNIFKNTVKDIPTRQRRMLNRILPGLCRLQAYREIVQLKAQPNHVRFFWAANKTGASRITVADLRKDLQIEKESVPATDTALLNAIEYDLELLQSLPDNEWLSKRRAIRVHPQCNIWHQDPPVGQEDAYLPIFYPVESPNVSPSVTPLETHDPDEQSAKRVTRSDRKVEDEPLLERLHVYRYQPKYRSYS